MGILEAFFLYDFSWWGLFVPGKGWSTLNQLDPTRLKVWTCRTSRTSLRYLLVARLYSVLRNCRRI